MTNEHRVARIERQLGVGCIECPRCGGSGEQDDVYALLDALEQGGLHGDVPTVPCDVCRGLGHVAASVLERRRLASDEQRAQLAALLDEFADLVTA